MGATFWIPLTITPYGDRLEPKTKDYVPDVVIQSVLDLNEILLTTNTNEDDANCDGQIDDNDGSLVEGVRNNLSRPFRSLSTGNAGKVTQLDDDGNNRALDKSNRRFAVSLLADMDSCSSSSSSAEVS